MKRLILVFTAVFGLAAAAAHAAAPLAGDGFVELRKGGIVQVHRFNRNYNDTCDLSQSFATGWISKDVLQQNSDLLSLVSDIQEQKIDSTRIRIMYDDIEKILLVDQGADYSPFLPESASDMVVTAIVPGQGKGDPDTRLEIGLKDAWFSNCFGQYVYAEVDDLLKPGRHVTQRFAITDIAGISFGALGELKWNPETGLFFPQNYLFDPYDGTRLKWYRLPADGLAGATEIKTGNLK